MLAWRCVRPPPRRLATSIPRPTVLTHTLRLSSAMEFAAFFTSDAWMRTAARRSTAYAYAMKVPSIPVRVGRRRRRSMDIRGVDTSSHTLRVTILYLARPHRLARCTTTREATAWPPNFAIRKFWPHDDSARAQPADETTQRSRGQNRPGRLEPLVAECAFRADLFVNRLPPVTRF